ncbi:hypothetical protein J40TS1_20930 [Paenibacillus montaniterrae]|uniref:Motility protein n=1 Tax=Paenibacillus montaniterrae TaxID=429341 RepID=A0A919YSD6_9BACL|nr:YjfB family protein [Paenibacillus montaniterrae]GIP16451.1 hypothetical protein J40TS1_20930 [Paenibacillus montaniterrae]
MDVAAASISNSLTSVKQEVSISLLKKSMDVNKDIASQLITKVLEGSLDPNLGKQLDIRV